MHDPPLVADASELDYWC